MGLKIYWTAFAEKELQQIFEYYCKNANYQVAKNIVDGIFNETLKLQKHEKIGQREDLLLKRTQGFRYLIYKNYKIIYWINTKQNWIEINDVFDVRQNPIKLTRTK